MFIVLRICTIPRIKLEGLLVVNILRFEKLHLI